MKDQHIQVCTYPFTNNNIEDKINDLPIVKNCNYDSVPPNTTTADGKRVIEVPDFVSMIKYMMSRNMENKRQKLYTYLNDLLHTGKLSHIVGFKVDNRVINKEACSFTGFSYFKINRNEFYTDIDVELKLQSKGETHEWRGVLVCWCGFNDKFNIEFDELTKDPEHADCGFSFMDPFLVCYHKSPIIDELASEMWAKYGMPEALIEPKLRNAKLLAEKMGLNVLYLPVYEHRNMESILFFEENELTIGTDKIEIDEEGFLVHIKDEVGETIVIPANTIVININKLHPDYADFAIFHECFHYEEHYLPYRLQKLTSNDVRIIKTKKILIEKDKEYKDPVYFMENQANRDAYGLLMPAEYTNRRIIELRSKITEYPNEGALYEKVGLKLSADLHIPHFRMRARMLQLGYPAAKGALNYVNKKRIQPFAFSPESWKTVEHTFVVTPTNVRTLYKSNSDFKKIMDSGRYVYSDGHVVRNDPKFVKESNGIYDMTQLALDHVDDCCLRFVRVYIQKQIGSYVLGRMYMDNEYIQQTLFYLDDHINKQGLDEFDAKSAFKASFPKDFKGAVDILKKYNHSSYAKIGEFMYMNEDVLSSALNDPKKYKNEDFLIALCLYFKLPDWISSLLFKRAHVCLDDEDKRHDALMHILRAQSCDGIDAANDYLKQRGVALLNWN